MGFSYEIDHEKGCMYTHVSGPITYKDLVDHMTCEVRDQGQVYPELFDAREATAAFSSDEVRRFIEFLKNLASKSRLGPTAVVVSDDLTYGMFRMLGTLMDDVCKIHPFRNMDEAKQWLHRQC
ncbi:MAG TPA: STAS/SEC14 domain-containing protein [Chthoniobacteraceae bacterium]|nr:STAS/SEC14 domain-containing protein [Chthoniobacteraceae bacterium]